MPECHKRDWGVCFVSKDFAVGEWTNKEWKILGNTNVMPDQLVRNVLVPARIPVLLDPIPELQKAINEDCLLYTSPSPRDRQKSRMPSSA